MASDVLSASTVTQISKMGGTLSIIIALLSFSGAEVNPKRTHPKTIPIGAVFHKDTVEMEAGFNYAILRHTEPKSKTHFEIKSTIETIDVSNSYELTKAMCTQMEMGVFVLFGMKNISTSSVVHSLTEKFHMPYLTSTLTSLSPRDSSRFELNMQPSYTLAIIDLILLYEWRSIYFIYDSDDGMFRLQELFEFFMGDIRILPRRLMDVYNAHEELRLIDMVSQDVMKALVVDLSSHDKYQVFLKQIAEVGMNKHGYHYLLAGLGFKELDLESFKHGGVNITGFQLLNYSSPKLQDFLGNWQSLEAGIWPGAGQKKINYTTALMIDSVEVFLRAIKKMLKKNKDVFKYTFRRGQIDNNGTIGIPCDLTAPKPWMHGNEIMEEMKQVDFEGLTGHVSFDERGQRKDYSLGIYEMGLHYGPEQVHEWNKEVGLNGEVEVDKMTDKGMDMANKTYIVSTILTEPYLMLKKDCPDSEGKCPVGNQKYTGYCADLAVEIGKLVGIDYILRPVRDSIYGNRLPNNSWTGMIGELVRKEADLAIADLSITVEREMVVDFSKPFMDLGISIMIKRPQTEKPGVFSFMAPLSKYIWMCIVFAYCGVSVALFLVSRLSPYEWKQMMSASGSVVINEFDIPNSFWFSLGALMQQGSDFFPRSVSGRLIGSVWWFFTLIIISSYTANLAAFLTIERMTTPIESADDLAEQAEIAYGTLSGGSTKKFFENSKVPTYQRMWRYMSTAEPSVFVKSVGHGVQRVRQSKGRYAFLVESTTNDYINNRKPCNTIKVGTNLDAKNFGIATPSGSPLSDDISMAVLGLHENGCLTKLKQKWWFDKGECGPQDGSKEGSKKQPLSLSKIAGIFYILIGGLALSMIVGLFELLFKSRLRRNDKMESSLQVLLNSPDPPPQNHANDISTIGMSHNHRVFNPPPPPERENGAFACDYPMPGKSVSTYSYGPPRLIGFEPLQESVSNSHTQV